MSLALLTIISIYLPEIEVYCYFRWPRLLSVIQDGPPADLSYLPLSWSGCRLQDTFSGIRYLTCGQFISPLVFNTLQTYLACQNPLLKAFRCRVLVLDSGLLRHWRINVVQNRVTVRLTVSVIFCWPVVIKSCYPFCSRGWLIPHFRYFPTVYTK